jgi:hypothetical protein
MSEIELPIAVTEAIPDWKTSLFSGQAVIHYLLKDAKPISSFCFRPTN